MENKDLINSERFRRRKWSVLKAEDVSCLSARRRRRGGVRAPLDGTLHGAAGRGPARWSESLPRTHWIDSISKMFIGVRCKHAINATKRLSSCFSRTNKKVVSQKWNVQFISYTLGGRGGIVSKQIMRSGGHWRWLSRYCVILERYVWEIIRLLEPLVGSRGRPLRITVYWLLYWVTDHKKCS